MYKESKSGTSQNVQAEVEIKNIPIKEIAQIIKQTKSAICGEAKNATFKFWLTVDVNAKADASIIAIGGNSQTGIEITLDCKKT